jgi:hypothetical protein
MRTLGVLLAALVLVGVASAARTATVTVRDSSLAPARVRVDAGGTVTWRNAGSRSHRLANSTGAFAAFSLAPGARKAVRFTRNGAHRYTVDGSRCGIVYVGVSLGPACGGGRGGGGGGTAPPPPNGTKVYTYNVVVKGSLKNEGYVDSGGRREQTWMRDYQWTSTFANFKFKVIAYNNGRNFVGVNAVGRAVASTARVTEKWDYFWHPHVLAPPDADCEGEVSGVVRSNLAVAAGTPTPPNYYVISQLPTGWDKTTDIQADCNTWAPPPAHTTEFRTSDGSNVDVDVGTLTIDSQRRTGGLSNPAGALANGRSFTLDSGVHISEEPTCSGACSGKLTITERYVTTFTRRP